MVGIYDIHTHILPGVDDGSDSMELTMKILKKEYQDGVRTIYATSHYRKGMFEPDMEEIRKQYQLVSEKASSIGEDLKILPGCEFHANMDMVDILKEHGRPLLGTSRCVLTEFSNMWEFKGIQERCYALLSNGFIPVIAHAERYQALYGHFDHITQLSQLGAYIQVNAASITGKDGFRMKHFCKKLMQEDLLDFVGSDVHNMQERKPLMGKCADYMVKTMGEDYTRKILIENPEEILEKVR